MATDNNIPEKSYGAFLKGYISDTTPLGYPEGSVVDCDNIIIKKTGDITRRPGLLSLLTGTRTDTDSIGGTYLWKEYGTIATGFTTDSPILVVCGYSTISFFDAKTMSLLQSLSMSIVPEAGSVSFAEGLGRLYVCGKGISSTSFQPFFVETDASHSTFTKTDVTIVIRDLYGLDDGLSADEEPTTLSAAHHYNLLNQGWYREVSEYGYDTVTTYSSYDNTVTTKKQYGASSNGYINGYYTSNGVYPPNNKVWYMVKTTAGGPDNEKTEKLCVGSGTVAKGHYLVCAWDIEYSAASGVSGLTPQSTVDRPTSVAFFAGRCWWAMNKTLYFSQVIGPVQPGRAGMCYQQQDPTAEDLNSLLATDGGFITIEEMGVVQKMIPCGAGLLILTDSGCWTVAGTSQGFSATDYAVNKVSSINCVDGDSVVETPKGILWWADQGIAGFSPSQTVYTGGSVALVSENKIQSWYKSNYSPSLTTSIYGAYDSRRDTVQWFFSGINGYKILCLDLTLGAFYPFSVSAFSDTPVNLFYNKDVYSYFLNKRVTVVGDESVVYCDDGRIGFFYLSYSASGTTQTWSLSAMWDESYLDFSGNTRVGQSTLTRGGGTSYESYFVVGFDSFGDYIRKKQTPYCVSYMRPAATGNPLNIGSTPTYGPEYFTLGRYLTVGGYSYCIAPCSVNSKVPSALSIRALGSSSITPASDLHTSYSAALSALETAAGSTIVVDEGYDPFPKYSLSMRACWDWSNNSTSNRWSNAIELYKASNMRAGGVSEDTLSSWVVNSDFDTIVVKSKLRGHGRSVAFRFDCNDPGTTFNIYGWSVWLSGNPGP